ncbi:unnamed protein product [Cunninghamella blakesleeana]
MVEKICFYSQQTVRASNGYIAYNNQILGEKRFYCLFCMSVYLQVYKATNNADIAHNTVQVSTSGCLDENFDDASAQIHAFLTSL